MVLLAKGFVAATPIIVRGLSGNFMLVAGPAVAAGAAGLTRDLANTRAIQARARSGGLSGAERSGRAIAQTPTAARAAALSSGAQIARIAERARRLGQ